MTDFLEDPHDDPHDPHDPHDDQPIEELPVEELQAADLPELDLGGEDEPGPWETADDPIAAETPHVDMPETSEEPEVQPIEVVGADPDALPDDPVTADVFPPMVDVGELPEPVDGFPWIDTGSLGVVDTENVMTTGVEPAELAEYAAADLPPGQDPWAALAGDEDPATSALARFYDPGRTSPDS